MHASCRETTGTSNINTTIPFPIFLIFYFGGANSFSVYILDFLSISWYKFTSIGAHVTFLQWQHQLVYGLDRNFTHSRPKKRGGGLVSVHQQFWNWSSCINIVSLCLARCNGCGQKKNTIKYRKCKTTLLVYFYLFIFFYLFLIYHVKSFFYFSLMSRHPTTVRYRSIVFYQLKL